MPLGKFFTLQPAGVAGCLLEVEGGSPHSGTAVVTRRPHGTGESHTDEQLWWEDRVNHTIRSKLNNFCLTADTSGKMVMHNFQSMNRKQRWRFDGQIIRSRDDEQVLGLAESESHPGGHVYAQDREDSFSEEWVREHSEAHILHIRNCSSNKVLDVAFESKKSGAEVIVYNLWPAVKNNQLWYEDHNGVIHSKLNDFALTSSDGGVTLQPYNEKDRNQQWVVSQQAIVNRLDPDRVLDISVPAAFFKLLQQQTKAVTSQYNGNASQRWEFIYTENNESTFGPKSHHVLLHHEMTGLHLTALPLRSLGIPSDRVDAVLLPKKPDASVDQLWTIDRTNNRIVSAADGKVLDLSGKEVVLNRCDDVNPNQKWQMVAMTIQNMSDMELHLGTVSSILTPDEDGILRVVARPLTRHQMPDLWKATKAPARFFFISSKHCDCVLDVKGGDAESGGEVIIFPRKPGQPADNQLWYEDEHRVIRSKLNNYLMDSSGNKICMRPYSANSPDQQWIITDDVIRNSEKPDLVLDIWRGSTKECTPIIPYEFHGRKNQRWTFSYI